MSDRAPVQHIDADEVFDWIVNFKSKHDGNSPSLRDMCDGLKLNSTSTAHRALSKLRERGLIQFDLARARCIVVVGGRWTYHGKGLVEGQSV